MLVPTTCFNCESACGLLAYVDRDDLHVRKFEGNPEHPGSRGRNCAKGPSTLNQVTDPDRILYPLRRVGERGAGQWERVSWDDALDAIAARIRAAIIEERQQRAHGAASAGPARTATPSGCWPAGASTGTTRTPTSAPAAVAPATSSGWGLDRPSPDHANAKVIYLISSHLETGHYFNPHAQRIIEAKANGAKIVVLDTRMSNTATHADYWLSPQPGSEAAINLAVARHLIVTGRYNREFVRKWWNWEEYLQTCRPDLPADFASFEAALATLYDEFTFDYAAAESGIDAATLEEVAETVAGAGTRFSSHCWRSAAASNLGGWQVQPHAGADHGPARGDRHRRWAVRQLLEQVRAQADSHSAAPRGVAGADVADGVSARAERDVVSAAATSSRRAEASSTPTSSASTTRCGPTRTACRGWRCSPTRRRWAASSR